MSVTIMQHSVTLQKSENFCSMEEASNHTVIFFQLLHCAVTMKATMSHD